MTDREIHPIRNSFLGVPLESIKKALEAAEVEFYDFGKVRVTEASIPWFGPTDIPYLFKVKSGIWKVLWCGKDEEFTKIGLGSLVQFDSSQELMMVSRTPMRIFGGFPFDRSTQKEWSEFADLKFFLPQMEWTIGRHSQLSIRTILTDHSCDGRKALLSVINRFRDADDSARGRPPQPLVCDTLDSPERQVWTKQIEQSKGLMNDGVFSKVVLSRCKTLSMSQPIDSAVIIEALMHLNEPSDLFAFEAPSGSIFLGRSPERILSWASGEVSADAIAGTRERGSTRSMDAQEAQNLQNSMKDLSEHQFVTDFVQQTIESFCDDVSAIDQAKLLRLEHVQHIITRFRGTLLEGQQPLDLLNALHPTPAVSGTPQKKAMKYLRDTEPFQRGWFAGSVGWFDGENGKFAIAIRSALIKDHLLKIFAGAGIVSGSDPDKEWAETQVKMENFLKIFPDQSAIEALPKNAHGRL